MRSYDRKDIYHSKAWGKIRKTIWIQQGCLCNRCGRPVYVDGLTDWIPKDKRLIGIVHHKEYLTNTNYTDDSIAYGTDNLEGLCIDCHNKEHNDTSVRKDLMFDENGMIIPFNPSHLAKK